MKIVSLRAENIKRLTAVEITPQGNVVEITGKNGQGKTSILDAIWWALGGKKPVQSKPVRDGAEKGVIELDIGDYVVTKTFKVKEGGDYTEILTVKNRDGFKASSPQDVLNGFLGELTFDPLSFSRMKAADQVTALRSMVPGFDFAAADQANKEDFAARTEVNRKAKDLVPVIDDIRVPDDTPDERISVESLMAELSGALDHNSKIDQQLANQRRLQDGIASFKATRLRNAERIANLERQIEDLRNEDLQTTEAQAEAERLLGTLVIDDPIDIVPIRQRISESETTNRNVDQKDRLASLVKQRKGLLDESEALTRAMEARKEAAAKAVREAKLPVAGLELAEDAVLLNGQPFDQASDAEQLRVSVAVAGAMNPKLRVVRVRDGSLLDEDSMAALARYAEENDLQIWVETVQSGRDSAIVIEDGMVAQVREAAE
ncbi:DNA repair exonuclease SbcCD ATPase subunit [Ancylobacter sp. 3268]|uniref:AAA family ATPase n=1 Tax=Ancylobacter sp. 3268 TaxID=2817752 RepID=UPI002856A301|nr:AAA family ATPase [Ancylobacter sp. 3268]MDR6954185.1 DNA repair exonuclease SbcCD ATPase subunit [Ancylobacter sp. 3268]